MQGSIWGSPRRIAEQLVYQTVNRCGPLRPNNSGQHQAPLRKSVTSPGGTTAEALYHLEKGGFRTVLSRAVWAAYVRATQLGEAQNSQKE
jgi:pyrroline-5-carboxylate reductase